MQISSKPIRPGGKAFALTITIIFLAVALMIFGSIMYWVAGNAKITERNNQYNMSSGAAEAAVEKALSAMDRDFMQGSLSNASAYNKPPSLTGWPIQYNYSDPIGGTTNAIYVLEGAPSTNTVALSSQFAGLYGLAQTCTISAKASPINMSRVSAYNVPATVTETVQFANIPLFQFAIFYNINLEIAPGQPMTITGPVFSNKGIWAGASDTTFSSTVTAVGSAVDTTVNDPFAFSYHPQDGGPTFSMAGQPTVQNDPITMPIGTNNNPAAVAGILALPPATFWLGTTAAYSTNGLTYPANAADLFITNSASGTNDATPDGTNTIVYFQDGFAATPLAPIKPDYYILKNPPNYTTNFVFTNMASGGAIGTATNYAGNVRFAGYSFITNSLFYDWREGWNGGSGIGGKGKAVQAVQIDIAKFSTWLTNAMTNANGTAKGGASLDQVKVTDSGHHIYSMYVYTSVPLTATTLPAVRVVNGLVLPTPGGSILGFTVATKFPMYVWGNYNAKDASGGSALGLAGNLAATAHTYPAALMADSITILSTNWSDAVTNKLPNSGNTTVNAAMLEGIVQTDNTISGNYSGGVENFMRLLEDWTQDPNGADNRQTLTYNGSIVVMFPSQYATNRYQNTGNYYNAPTRNWSFDQNFKTASKLPPLTPQSKALVRGQWMGQ